jgi:lipoprotein NlpD
MSFHRSTPKFFASLILMLVLITCTKQGNYAPVMTSNSRPGEDQQNPPKSNQDISKADQDISEGKQGIHEGTQDIPQAKQVVTEVAKKFHLVKNGETLYSIGLSSGHGYQRLALWNHISPPYKIIVGKKIKLFKPDLASELSYKQQKVAAAKKVGTRPKKAGNSLTNKTNLEDRSTHKKKQTNLAVLKKTAKKQKKSIVSIENKKISELNFDWPIKGSVLKSFSPAYNKGINIAGKLGQSVRATEAGVVVYCGQRLIGFGQLLIIKHNKVYLSAYANNRRLLVKEGQQVEKGQVIAEVGKVGTKRTSLHFEIRKNGNPVNPLKLLPKR